VARDRAVDSKRAQPGKIAADLLRAGEHDQVGAVQIRGGACPSKLDSRHAAQRLELVEVADVRRAEDSDSHGLRAGDRSGRRRDVEEAVLVRQPMATHHRYHAGERHAGQELEIAWPGLEQRSVATEAVQDKAVQRASQVVGQQGPSSVQMRERAAAVDVGDEQAREAAEIARLARGAEIDVVLRCEIDLRGRARAFDHHEIAIGGHARQARACGVGERCTAFAPALAREIGVDVAVDDHLARRVALGLEQDGIHVDRRLDTCRERLEILRRADLRAEAVEPGDDPRVVAHVLRLEGCTAMPRRAATRHSAVASQLLPAPLDVPQTIAKRVIAEPASSAKPATDRRWQIAWQEHEECD
jgi:hypothetical protein